MLRCSRTTMAALLARELVEARLAACVNVITQIRSYYRWKGKTEVSDEVLLIIKTSRDLFEALRVKLEAAHSYELPELLALPVIAGSPNYLSWLTGELAAGEQIA